MNFAIGANAQTNDHIVPPKSVCSSLVDAAQQWCSIEAPVPIKMTAEKTHQLRYSLNYLNQFEEQILKIESGNFSYHEENRKMIEKDKCFYNIKSLIKQTQFHKQIWNTLPTDHSYVMYSIMPHFDREYDYDLSFRLFMHEQKMMKISSIILMPLADRRGIQMETRGGAKYQFSSIDEGLKGLETIKF